MASDGFASLSVPELKDVLSDRGVDCSTAVEKGDLLTLVRSGADAQMTLARAIAPGRHHDIEQNSEKWFHMRRGEYGVRVGGSEIGYITGVSPYKKPVQLYNEIVAKEEGTWEKDPDEDMSACEHGTDCEPLVAGMYKHYVLADTEFTMSAGGYYQHPDETLGELYGASPDRRIVSPGGKTAYLLEIKAPYGRMYTTVKPEYMAQIQYQMWCSGLERCDFVAVKFNPTLPEKTPPSKIRVYYARVMRNEAYIKWMLPRLYYFSRCIILRQRPARDLYENEMTGREPPPDVPIDEVIVPNGAWTLQGEA